MDKKKRDRLTRISILVGLTIILSLFFPGGKSLEYNYELNDITRDEIVAEFDFPILKEEAKLEADIREAISNEPYLFKRNRQVVDQQVEAIGRFIASLNAVRQAQEKVDASRRFLMENRYGDRRERALSRFQQDSLALELQKEAFRTDYPFFDLSQSPWVNLIQDSEVDGKGVDLAELKSVVITVCQNRWKEGILDIDKEEIESAQIAVLEDDVPEIREIDPFNDLQEAWGAKTVDDIAQVYPEDGGILRGAAYKIVVEFMKPNVIFDRETTERRQQAAVARVPRYRGFVMKNERIVDANTRITPEILLKLKSYARELDKREKAEKGLAVVLAWLSRLVLAGVILSFFFSFLRTYRGALFENNQMLLLFGSMFLVIAGIGYLLVSLDLSEYLIPTTVLAMVITVLFDARIAVMAAVTLAIFLAFVIGGKLDYAIISLFTSVAAIYAVRNLRKRAQLFSAILYILVSGFIAITALGILKRSEWSDLRPEFLFLAISGMLAPFLTYGLSALFEMIFDVTSDLTLLELTDFNHPLLKRLSREANGTFNHCVVVGNLAESCAMALDANPLLCRVGAYYHDIGKLTRPEYFIENQFRGQNRHDNLSPTLSARIIASHVKDGIKLAREYRLPSAVTDFVPMHHGTSRIEYFYQKAVEQADGDASGINESDFRYPGPKPNTKETGILMICEAVEAAVRSIKNPNLHRIEAMVDRVIEKRLKEGQLDECPLTMGDLARMKGNIRGGDGLLPVLRGIYHLRIEYPGQKEPGPSRKSP